VISVFCLTSAEGPGKYAGHSLRAGFATARPPPAAPPNAAIMRQTGHRSLPMLRRYIREGRCLPTTLP
jgi:hypothetical protein